jgi:hypothetical protein
LHPKHELVNFVGLQFQGFYEEPKTIDNKRSKVYNICIGKLVCTPRDHFMKVGNLIIYKYSNKISLILLCNYFMIRIMRVLHSQSFNDELQPTFMKVLLECSIMFIKCANLIK